MTDLRLYHRPFSPAVPQEGIHHEDIKAMIRKRGSTLSRISIEAGMPRASACVGLKVPFPKANRAIAAFLGLPLHTLWPKWYDAQGRRIYGRSPVHNSKARGSKSHAGNLTIAKTGEAHV